MRVDEATFRSSEKWTALFSPRSSDQEALVSMWISRAVINVRWCISASSHFARGGTNLLDPSCASSLLNPSFTSQSLLPDRGHSFLQQRGVVYNKVTKNKQLLNKTRDAAFENLMDSEKKMKIMRKIIAILQKEPSGKMQYRFMLRLGRLAGLVKPQRMSDILEKYPRIVKIYQNSNKFQSWVRLAEPILALLEEEKKLKQERAPYSVDRLRKLLMMSAKKRIRLDRIFYLREELGLPDDFKETVIKANPRFFKLVKARKDIGKEDVYPWVKLLEWDPQLAIPAVQEHRQKEALANRPDEKGMQKIAYSFPISFPPGFKIKKGFRFRLKQWQELPYRSPYDDSSDLSLQSPEARKRAVAVIHEFLHISVEKRTRVDRIAHLREDLKIPQKTGITILQHPGIFYLSIKSAVQTIFLREGYKKGELIQKDALYTTKEKFLNLLKMGRRNINRPDLEAAPQVKDMTLEAKQDNYMQDYLKSEEKDNTEVTEEEDYEYSGKPGVEIRLEGNNNGSFMEDDSNDSQGENVVSGLDAWSEDYSTESEDEDLDAENVLWSKLSL